jgi:hypothetical protein
MGRRKKTRQHFTGHSWGASTLTVMYGKAVGALTTRIHKENERGREGAGGRDTRS